MHFAALSYRLHSAITKGQRRLAGQDQRISQLLEEKGIARTEQDSQVQSLRAPIGDVAKKAPRRAQEGLGAAGGIVEVLCQISQTEKVVEPAALGVAETKDRMSRVESDVAGLTVARRLRV
jgi:hypothetical protein